MMGGRSGSDLLSDIVIDVVNRCVRRICGGFDSLATERRSLWLLNAATETFWINVSATLVSR